MPSDFATVAAPFRMQPGLRRVAAGAAPLTPNRLGSAHLAAKLAVLQAGAGEALLTLPGFDPTAALNAVLRQAALDHPEAIGWDGAGELQARWLGWSVQASPEPSLGGGASLRGDGPPAIGDCLRALPPERRLTALLCLALEEDLAVIDGATGVIPWLAVCLPSRWSPRQKIGRHFAEVHAEVADNRLLIAAADSLTRLVTGPDRWERFVWTITTQPELDTHPQRRQPPDWPPAADADSLAAAAWFRTEHQTFIPLPAPARQAVFTIRVAVAPLADAIQDVPGARDPHPHEAAIGSPEKARRLHDALASMSAAVLAYRGLAPARDRLLAWLEARAG